MWVGSSGSCATGHRLTDTLRNNSTSIVTTKVRQWRWSRLEPITFLVATLTQAGMEALVGISVFFALFFIITIAIVIISTTTIIITMTIIISSSSSSSSSSPSSSSSSFSSSPPSPSLWPSPSSSASSSSSSPSPSSSSSSSPSSSSWSSSWSSSSLQPHYDYYYGTITGWTYSNSSFLFTLKNDLGEQHKMPVYQSKDKALFNSNMYGPSFGVSDLVISNRCTKNRSHSNLGKSYKLPNGFTKGDPRIDQLLAGSNNFLCSEYEVFYREWPAVFGTDRVE